MVHNTFFNPTFAANIFVQTIIKNGKVKGSVMVPASKSLLQRYLIAALLSDGETELHSVSHCNDTVSCLKTIQTLGAKVIRDKDGILKIRGVRKNIQPLSDSISCGESGFALRALSAVTALSSSEIKMTGNGS